MFKNKMIVAGVLLGLSSGLVTPVLAHNENNEDKNKIGVEARADMGINLKDLNEMRREENKLIKEVVGENRKEDKQKNRLSKTWKKIEKRIGAVIKGQEDVVVKLDNHLNVMASNSMNVVDLKAKLSTAVSLINISKIALTEASVKANAAIQGTQSHEETKTILQGLVSGLKDKIKASHRALVDVMVGIRLKTGTPTPTPTS